MLHNMFRIIIIAYNISINKLIFKKYFESVNQTLKNVGSTPFYNYPLTSSVVGELIDEQSDEPHRERGGVGIKTYRNYSITVQFSK